MLNALRNFEIRYSSAVDYTCKDRIEVSALRNVASPLSFGSLLSLINIKSMIYFLPKDLWYFVSFLPLTLLRNEIAVAAIFL